VFVYRISRIVVWPVFDTSASVAVAFEAPGGQEASRVALPLSRDEKLAVSVRNESRFGVPWNRPWVSVTDGLLVGQLKAKSTVGDDSPAEIRVTIQRV